jgi:hypothetical protein
MRDSSRLPVKIGVGVSVVDIISVLPSPLGVGLESPASTGKRQLRKAASTVRDTDETCVRHKLKNVINSSADDIRFQILSHLATETTCSKIF